METRQANGLTVIRYRITGTTAIVYTAWEPYNLTRGEMISTARWSEQCNPSKTIVTGGA